MTSGVRVAAAQATSVPGDVAANVATAVGLVRSAADAGARVVVLPELFLTGYDAAVFTPEHTVDVDDARLGPLRAVARDAGAVLVAGAAVRRGPDRLDRQVFTLSLLVVDAAGEVTAPYDKQHLFAHERGFFTPGDHGASLVVDGVELGLSICYDGCFPEHARAAAYDGADAYLNAAAYFTGSEHRRDLYYAARALDNGVHVVFSGLTGRCGAHEFNGGSAVYDPEGRPLARIGLDDPGLAVADVDPELGRRTREAHSMLADVLPDLGPRVRHEVR